MTPLAPTISITLAAVFALMLLTWMISLIRRDASIVDPVWGFGFSMVAWMAWGLSGPSHARGLLLVGLTTAWGMRLSLFLLWRNWGQPEDRRYRAMRQRHGRRFAWVSLIKVFLLQGVLLWFISLPVQVAVALNKSEALGIVDATGLALWGIGLFFETVGDWQLARFRAQPNHVGRVMERGLWKYTRHPNYFGDFCVWWGLYLVATAGGAWLTVLSPILMSILLLKVSGVTLLESDISQRRPEYASYKARTNPFFPWFPKA